MGKMLDGVTYRPFKTSDFDSVANLLGRLWCSDLVPEARELASRIELSGYLAQTTHARVAELDDELVGAMLLAELDRVPRDATVWRRKRSRLVHLTHENAHLACEVAKNSDVIDEESRLAGDFAASGAVEGAAVMKLLAVDPATHGRGIGGRLFEEARRHLREEGVGGFFLLTDDGCDVSFYDHKGLARAMTRPSRVDSPAGSNGADEFNLYVYADRF